MTSVIERMDRNRIFQDLKELVAYNSVHGQPEAADAAQWVAKALSEHGLEVTSYDTEDGSITVIGTKPAKGDAPTVLLYSHYDVVPAGPREAWISDPFTLTERDGRWYGRGTADCKGNLVMHLAALRAIDNLDAGIIFLVEGSEEDGGVGLEKLIEKQPELFQADVILIADSGNVGVGKPTLTTALRGGAQLTVTVDTLRTPGHSGLYGGAAPDAVAALMRTLDSLRDASGHTTIDGVDTSQRWEGEEYDVEEFRQDAGVLEGVELYTNRPADAVWAQPAITVTGFTSTPVAEAVNAVPATASARVNLRIPHGMDPHDTAEKLAAHIKAHTPWGAHVDVSIDEVNPTFATDVHGPYVQRLGEALRSAYGTDTLSLVGSGGSIPLTAALQKAVPQAEILVFGVEEPLCTIHSPNESVDPTEIEHIAAAEALFLSQL